MIKLNSRIILKLKGDNSYDILDREDKLLIDSEKDYFIYFKNVNFKKDGSIIGIYLGELKENSILLDNRCKDVSYQDDKFIIGNGKIVKKARMVAVNNKNKTIIIIEN